MNPGDIAQSVAPLTSSNLSLFHLFWHAHWIVESVMVESSFAVVHVRNHENGENNHWVIARRQNEQRMADRGLGAAKK